MSSHLSPMQQRLLEMLRWFDGFCRDNKLRYYAIGGTLLGAARHKGFIPWDDDIDVALPREAYDRLAALTEGKSFGNYVFEFPKTAAADFCYPYAKLYDTSSTLIEHRRKPMKRGVFIDIFPLDGIGPDVEAGKRHMKKIQRDFRFYVALTGALRKGRSFYKNAAVVAARVIPPFIAKPEKLRKALDADCRRYDYDRSDFVGNFFGLKGERELVPRPMFGEPVELSFEDMTVLCPESSDAYLTRIYGDWRKLPPEDERSTHHDFLFLDMEQPYL